MIRAATLACAIALLPATALADRSPDETLQALLAGRHAGAPMRCIMPDLSVNPRVIDGTALVYRRGRDLYLGRLRRPCDQLRWDRTIVTQVNGGMLCRNDPVRVVQFPGGIGFGFCTFEGFTPYTK